MPKLRVLISTADAYPPATLCPVNGGPVRVRTPHFDGEISVFVKGYSGDGAAGDGAAFFEKRPGLTYAMVVRGRYLDGVNGNDLVFGNVFERPIRDSLPWGTAIATKFMYFVDPTLELDVYADRPWALSPVLSTMNQLALRRAAPAAQADPATADPKADPQTGEEEEEEQPEAPTAMGIFRAVDEDALHILDRPETGVAARRKFYGSAGNREKITFDERLETEMEFGSGVLDFATLSVTLPNPFPLSISLLKYWDGQPVIYACRRRAGPGEDPVSAEGMYWSVAFEIVDEDAKRAVRKKGKSVLELKVKDSAVGGKGPAGKEGKGECDAAGGGEAAVPAAGVESAGVSISEDVD